MKHSSQESPPPLTPLLNVRHLSIQFHNRGQITHAVNNLSFEIQQGASLAIVGESGSGKSVTALALTRLLATPPAHYPQGEIWFENQNILTCPQKALEKIRGGKIAYIFQEPSTSLNPVYTIGNQIAETIRLHRPAVSNVTQEVIYWLNKVGIQNAAQRLKAYPHQLSGGMQQRVMIAMALSAHPSLLVADEPTTALDVTIQAQILDELRRLRQELKMSILLITHNFAIIRGLCDHVLVLFRGQVVESGPTEQILTNPQHPYTQALIDCIPKLGQGQGRLKTIDYEKIVKSL